MATAVRVMGGLVVLAVDRPAQRRIDVRFLAPGAWGDGVWLSPAMLKGTAVSFEARASRAALDVWAGKGALAAGGYDRTRVETRRPMGGPGAWNATLSEALGEVQRVGLTRRFVGLPAAFPLPALAAEVGDGGLSFAAVCRGATEALAGALDEEHAALGAEHGPLRDALARLHEGAAGGDVDPHALRAEWAPRWRRAGPMDDAAALWWAALSEDLVPLLARAAGRLPAPPSRELVQGLVARVGLARALRTEDPAEGFAWAEAHLREGFVGAEPALAAFLRGHPPPG